MNEFEVKRDNFHDVEAYMSQKPQDPNDCDCCSNNFLSHTIHYCPDCGLCYCDSCWDREHHCYDEGE